MGTLPREEGRDALSPHLRFPQDQIGKALDEQRAGVEGWGAAELQDTLAHSQVGIGDVDLVERFDVVADK